MKTNFLKMFLFAVCSFGILSAAHADPSASDDKVTPPHRPRPPHCDPWFTDQPRPSPEPTFEPIPIQPGDQVPHAAPAVHDGYGDCDDDDPVPTPTPTPSPSASPTPEATTPPSDEPDDPNEQNFPNTPEFILEGSGTLFGCGLNATAPVQTAPGLWIFGMILAPALWRRLVS